jgi:hypothetical protein
MVVETPPGAAWVVVADRTQESMARIILAHAALSGVKTALVLTEAQRNILIQVYPILSMAKAVRMACPDRGRRPAEGAITGEALTDEAKFRQMVPVVCRHCGHTHAWAVKDPY